MSRGPWIAAFPALAALCAWSAAGAAGAGEGEGGARPAGEDSRRVVAGESVDPRLPRVGQFSARPKIQKENPFRLEIAREQLPRDASGIADLLLEVYDPEAGRWRGYGLMTLKRERPEGGPLRVCGASVEFSAPAEGICCLRAVARDAAGNVEPRPADLSDVDWVVVLDRTPPKVEIVSPAEAGLLKPGARLEVEWRVAEAFPAKEVPGGKDGQPVKSHRVEVSHDGGRTWRTVHHSAEEGSFAWEPTGPDTDALLLRVAVTDAAGNVGTAVTERPLRLSGFAVSGLAASPSEATARRLYQQGVVYMTRGARRDCEAAVRSFGDALSHDPKMLPAYVDLSATHLHLYDLEQAAGGPGGARELQDAEACLQKALAIAGFDREVSLHYNLAQVRCRRGRLAEAAESLDRGLKVSPRHVPSLSLLAYVRWKQRGEAAAAGQAARAEGHAAEARKLWRQVAALGGSGDRLAQQAVRCLEEAERAGRAAQAAVATD